MRPHKTQNLFYIEGTNDVALLEKHMVQFQIMRYKVVQTSLNFSRRNYIFILL